MAASLRDHTPRRHAPSGPAAAEPPLGTVCARMLAVSGLPASPAWQCGGGWSTTRLGCAASHFPVRRATQLCLHILLSCPTVSLGFRLACPFHASKSCISSAILSWTPACHPD